MSFRTLELVRKRNVLLDTNCTYCEYCIIQADTDKHYIDVELYFNFLFP